MSLRKTIVLILLSLLTGSVFAQCTLTQGTTSSAAAGGAGSSLTFSAATSGSNRLLVVRVSTYSSDPTSVTYNAVSLTKLVTKNNGNLYASIWYLVAPATGSHNVVVSGAAGFTPIAAATPFTGASQSSPFGTPVTGNYSNANPSLNVSSASGQIVIDVLTSNTSLSIGTGQTNSYSASSVGWYGSGSSEAGAGTVTMSWIGLSPIGTQIAVALRSCTFFEANAGADKNVCLGDAGTTIGGSPTASGGTAPYTYSWSPSTGLSSTTVANPTATPTSNTTYTVTVTDNLGATATDAVLVTATAKPTVSAGSNKEICTAGSTTIGGSPTASGGTSPYTYAWSPTTGLSPATAANPTASPTSNTTYTVIATDNKGCSNSSTVTVTINSKPTVNAGTDKTVCIDSTITIGGSPTATGGTSPYTYAWTPSGNLSSATVANPTATPDVTTTYSVTATDAKGCSTTDEVLVTVNQNTVTLTASPGINLCVNPGQTIKFTATPTHYEQYNFYRNGVLTQSGTSNVLQLSNPVTSDQVYVKVLNSSPDTVINPCISSLVLGSSINGSAASGATSLSLSYTVAAGSNRLLVVRASTVNSDPSSITYNGTALTKYASANNGTIRASIWYLVNPVTGTFPVVINGAAGFTPIVGVTAFTGAHQTTPLGTSASSNFSSSTTPSVNVSSAHGQRVIDVINSQVNYAVGSGQTQQYTKNQSPYYGEGSSEAGANTVTMSWTGTASTGVLLAVPVKPFSCIPDTVITNPVCSKGKSNVLTLTISPKPVITITPVAHTLCKDESIILSASGATVYTWSPVTGLNTTSAANVIATPLTTTTYTVVGTGMDDCKDTATVTVTVNPSCPNACNSTTGAWTANGTGSQKVTINGLEAVVYLTKTTAGPISSNYAFNAATFNPTNFWSQNLSGHAALQIGLIWDENEEAGLTDIDLPADDKGTETFKIVFSKEVLDPILHIDRIGGNAQLSAGPPPQGKSNSVLLTLLTPGLQLIKLAGTDDFDVTPYTIQRTKDLTITDLGIEATMDRNTGTAAGSVKILGLVKEALFKWTGVGVEGAGADDIEIVLEYCNDSLTPCSKVFADAGPDKTICPGSAVSIGNVPQPGYTYSWSPATGLSCTTCANPLVTGDSTINYTLTVTYSNCTAKTDQVLITVNNTAVSEAGPDKSVCPGSGVQLGVPPITGYNYSWAPVTGLSCTTCSNPIASPTSNINYTLTVSSPFCTTSGTDQVLVSVSNSPVANAGNDKNICAGIIAQLGTTPQSNYTYSWSPATALSCTTCSNPFANPTTTTNYTVTVSDANCATTTTDVVVVLVSTKPFADAGPDKTICPNSSIQLGGIAEPYYTYSWTPAAGLNCTTCANPLANPTTATNYTLQVSSPNCSQISTDEVHVSISDTPIANAGADQSVCAGASVQLGTTAHPEYSYSWTPVTGLSCTACADPVATPTVATTYSVTVTALNCTGTGYDDATVTLSTTPAVDAGSDKTICPGLSTQLGTTAQPGYTYSWSPATGLSCTNCSNPQAKPGVSTTYTLTVNSTNCTDIGTDEVVVIVSNTPLANAGPDQYICPGNTVQLGVSPQPGYSYSWTPAAGLSCSTCADPLANPATTTNYQLNVTAVNCSSSSTDMALVTVNTSPKAIAGNDKIICSGATTQIGGPSQVGYVYSWTPSAGLSCNNCSNPTVSISSTTSYTLTVTSPNCIGTGSDQVTISVSDFDPAVSGNQQICYGNDIRLNATGGITYNWTPVTGLSCSTCPNPLANPLSTTTYSVSITDVNGCVKQKNVTVAVSSALSVSAGADASDCIDSVVTLHASGADTYIWSPSDGLSCTTCADPTVTISKNIMYVVTGFSGDCNGKDSVNVTVPVETNINYTYTQTGCNVTFTANISGLNSYTWNFGDGVTASTSTVTHQFTKNGIYHVCLTAKDDCNRDIEVCKFIEIKPGDCNCETN